MEAKQLTDEVSGSQKVSKKSLTSAVTGRSASVRPLRNIWASFGKFYIEKNTIVSATNRYRRTDGSK